MIGSIRLDGSNVSMTVEGATDTDVFRAYVREVLCPTLHPEDVVIMDNLSPHKSDSTLRLIEEKGVWPIETTPEGYSQALHFLIERVKSDLRHPPARIRAAIEFAVQQNYLQPSFANGTVRWAWVDYL